MGLFTRANRQPASKVVPPGFGKLGSGRRLKSGLRPDECATLLEALLDTYGPRKYAQLPHLVPAGIDWTSQEGIPVLALAGEDENKDFILFTLGAAADGTDAGLFALGNGDDPPSQSVVGHWKQRDPSLTSVGTWPGGTVLLGPPPVDDSLIDGTLSAAGFPATTINRAILAEQFEVMVLIKCYELVGKTGGDAAERQFRAAYDGRRDATRLIGPSEAALQLLAETFPGVQPYMQDLPLRIRALLLEPGTQEGTIWEKLERTATA